MLNSEALAEPASASTGRIAPFGKYLLLQRVSVGGMAEIFKALPQSATRIDEIVAIKRILPNIAEDSEFIGMFIDEARIAGQLNHPNICRIYELGRVHNDHYIAMQFLWGRDLLKVMNRYKKAGRFVSPTFAAWVGARACSALHYAHTKCDEQGRPLHIIHRDVSPQNIIIGYSGQVKLIDFGVARAASQSQRTQAGILKGKFGYMSPEMIRGMPIDHRSDVFAMGICLHELLTSSRLFYGETDFATLELVRDAKVLPPSRKSTAVPPGLDAIVMKALSRDPDQRFQSAAEMEAALLEFLARYDRQYGQTDVGLAMRQAFHVEVQRERERLEIFWKMLERGELVRGAAVPPSAPTPTETGQRAAPPRAAAPLESAAPPPSPEPSDDELQEEQTHIFFSASELDELRELEAQRGLTREPTLSDMIPPAPPSAAELDLQLPPPSALPRRGSQPPVSASPYEQGPRGFGTRPPAPPSSHNRRPGSLRPGAMHAPRVGGSAPPVSAFEPRAHGSYAGSHAYVDALRAPEQPPHAPSPFDPHAGHEHAAAFERAAATPQQGSAQAYAPRSPFDPPAQDRSPERSSRPSGERLVAANELPPERANKGARYAVFALLIATVALATYAVPRFADAGTGALQVESVGDADALVRVDGVVRGNPPLVVEGLTPGVHRVEVEASGFEVARADVHVESGQARPVRLTLEKAAPGVGAQAAPMPLDRPPEITPLASPPGKPAAAATAAKPTVKRVVAPAPKPPQATTSPAEPSDESESDEAQSEHSAADEASPTVKEGGSSETQTDEALNEELAAMNEGELLISTVPWSHVFVDDVDTGRDTPVRSLRVPAGPHRIGLRTPDDVMHQVDVVVEAGKVVRIIRRF